MTKAGTDDATGQPAAVSGDDDGGSSGGVGAKVGALKGAASGRWAGLKARYRWLRHVIEAYALMQRNNANQYAAAITYFSFLALFPLLLLAVSVTGFVLHAQPATEASLYRHVASSVPGELGQTIKTSIQTAIKVRTQVGIIGLAGVLLTGLGWIQNLRSAIDAVWGRRPAKQNFVMAKVSSLLVLAGLGLGVIVSLGLTVVGTSVTTQLLKGIGLDSVPGATILLKLIGIAIAVLGDMIIFSWLLVRLPQITLPAKLVLRGALLTAVGFEILKIVGTYTIAKSAGSKTAGPFAVPIALLVWIQLVSRWILFCCAWLATARDKRRAANSVPITPPAAMVRVAAADAYDRAAAQRPVGPGTVGASLLGAGAVAGAGASWVLRRRAARRRDTAER